MGKAFASLFIPCTDPLRTVVPESILKCLGLSTLTEQTGIVLDDYMKLQCLQSESGGSIQTMTDDILMMIFQHSTSSVASVYRLKSVCKRWNQILDSSSWRHYISQEIDRWHASILKYEYVCTEERRRKNWRVLSRELKFFCPLEQKWFSTPKRLKSSWNLVGSEGGLLCYQSLHNWRRLCVENPLKQPGYFMVPSIPEFDETKDTSLDVKPIGGYHGNTVRLIVNRNPDLLKIVLTVFADPLSRFQTEQPHGQSIFSVVFDSTDMRWSIFPRGPSHTCIDGQTPTSFVMDVIFFQTERKSRQSLTLVRFNTVSGVWDETTFSDLPCKMNRPLTFFERDGRIYLVGKDHDQNIRVWRLCCSVQEFFTSDYFELEVHSTMPREISDSVLSLVKSRSGCYITPFSQKGHDSICLNYKMIWITYDVTTDEWRSWETKEMASRSGFSWVPQLSPLTIAGVEL